MLVLLSSQRVALSGKNPVRTIWIPANGLPVLCPWFVQGRILGLKSGGSGDVGNHRNWSSQRVKYFDS